MQEPVFPAAPDEDALTVAQDHPGRRVDEAAVRTLVRRVVEGEGCTLRSLSVVLTDHATVHALNARYLDHDYETDVLSFSLAAPEDAPGDDACLLDGEVYVDLDTAAERHAEFDVPFELEVFRYVVHGVLHLAGYNDATEAGQRRMRDLEDRYLRA